LNPLVQNFSLRDLRLIPTFSCEAEMGIPVSLDGVSEISPIMLGENLPFVVDNGARAVPRVKIVLAHRGGRHILDGYAAALFEQGMIMSGIKG
jgi:predicted TIM-barrel fold metal-dependent hydrolase